MQAIGLHAVDWVIILFYFASILGLGLYLKKFTKNEEDFFLAGRRNSAWVAGLAFLSANLGALELLGMTGNTFKYGMSVAHFYWIGAIPAMLFLGLYMMPFYYSSRINSVPGYLKLRFDEKTRVLNGISFAVMTVLVSGINLYAMALVLHTFLGWNWDVSMWVSAATVAAYVTLSGLMSAIFTEIIQFFLIWFGLFLVSILGIIEIGSVGEIMRRIPEAYAKLWSTTGDPTQNGMLVTWGGIVLGLGFVLSFGYWTTDFLVVQRAFSAKDLRVGAHDADHRLVLQDGRAVHRRRRRPGRPRPLAAIRTQVSPSSRTAGRRITIPRCPCSSPATTRAGWSDWASPPCWPGSWPGRRATSAPSTRSGPTTSTSP